MTKENNLHLAEQLRAGSLCGQCKSSTLLGGWSDETVSKDNLPSFVIDSDEHECSYMIRCDYFKLTIPEPETLQFCETFKKRG